MSRGIFRLLTDTARTLTLKTNGSSFPADTEAQLKQFAAIQGKDAPEVVTETVVRVLEQRADFIAGVNRGIAGADRGELIEHAEVAKRIEQVLRP